MDIDLSAVVANWRALNAKSTGRAGAVVKADCYGLGAARIAPVLDEAGCRDYFVAVLSEAEALREILMDAAAGDALDDRHIYVMNGFAPDPRGLAACDMAGPRIAPVAKSLKDWRAWAAFWRIGAQDRAPVAAIQIETGMNRLGVSIEDLSKVSADEFPEDGALLAMSHLASSDQPWRPQTEAQRGLFQSGLKILKPLFPWLEASLAATGGINDDTLHYDLTRPGIGLYGGAPFADAKPVVEFSAPILHVWEVEAGAKVGYGATWTAPQSTKLATVAAGYADGLPRALSNNGVAKIGGALCPIVGRVSMDLVVLDVSDPRVRPSPGDRALFLAHGEKAAKELHIDAMADRIDTIGYEILTRLGAAPRVQRRYRGGA